MDAENPTNVIERQMAGQWTAMLQLMTQQGATRLDIMELASATTAIIITITADNLWPQGEAVHPELNEAALFTAAQTELESLLEFIRHRKAALELRAELGEGGTDR